MTIFLKTFGTSDVLVALVYLPGLYSVHFGDLDGHPNPRFHDPRPWRLRPDPTTYNVLNKSSVIRSCFFLLVMKTGEYPTKHALYSPEKY